MAAVAEFKDELLKHSYNFVPYDEKLEYDYSTLIHQLYLGIYISIAMAFAGCFIFILALSDFLESKKENNMIISKLGESSENIVRATNSFVNISLLIFIISFLVCFLFTIAYGHRVVSSMPIISNYKALRRAIVLISAITIIGLSVLSKFIMGFFTNFEWEGDI